MSRHTEPKLPRQNLTEGLALVSLLVLAALALFGPSGLLSWSENRRLLGQRQLEVKALATQRDVLRNRVTLLDPRNTDTDLAGELLRKDLNVIHPDEMLILTD
ncbi:MAG: septum formation initiator [Novosphingobium sp.]